MFKLHVDDKTFVLMRETIEAYPNTLLANVIKNCTATYKYLKISGNDIYIDRDPESFKYVIDRLRRYEINLDGISDEFFKKRVIDDLDYFDLYCTFDESPTDVNICNIDNDKVNETTQPNSIPDPLMEGITESTPDPIGLMTKLSNNDELMNLIKSQSSNPDNDSASGSLDMSDDEDYELV